MNYPSLESTRNTLSLSLSLYKASEYTVNYSWVSTCQGVRGGQLSDWILDTVERVGSVSTKLEIRERRAERDKCGEWGDCETCITDLGQPVPLHWGKRLSQFFFGRRQRVWWTEARQCAGAAWPPPDILGRVRRQEGVSDRPASLLLFFIAYCCIINNVSMGCRHWLYKSFSLHIQSDAANG